MAQHLDQDPDLRHDDKDQILLLPTVILSPGSSPLLVHTEIDHKPELITSLHPDADVEDVTVHLPSTAAPAVGPGPPASYRLYKRRFIGLVILSLLNIIISWCWLVFASVAAISADYFQVNESTIDWLTTGYLFAFVIASPVAMYTLNKGVKSAMVVAGSLSLISCWMRYGGTRLGHRGFPLAIVAQVLCGFAQPFVLAAPTRYSHVWFSEKGRITATAVASLANPLGGALGQLIGPLLASSPERLPMMVFWVAVITTIIALPTPFIPSTPPTPPCHNSETTQTLTFSAVRALLLSPTFHLVAWPFVLYVAAFTATSSLLSQILQPYGFSDDQAGIDGAILIVAGLLSAAVASPLLDRRPRLRLYSLKTLVIIVAACYVAFIFVPRTRSLPGPFVVSAFVGAASFTMLPLALELLVDLTYPIGPEVSSTVCWATSQLFGGLFIIAMGHLKGAEGKMDNAMVFQAVLCCAVLPLPLSLGVWNWAGRKQTTRTIDQ